MPFRTQRGSILRGAFVALGALSSLALPQVARAEIIFSNLSPAAGSGFDTGVGHILGGGTSVFGYQAVAASFIPTKSYLVTSLEIAGIHLIGSNSYTFSLRSDIGGFPATTTLTSGVGALPTASPGLAAFGASTILHAGVRYWLVSDLQNTSTVGDWFANAIGDNGHLDTSSPNGPWNASNLPTPAFRISGQTAPEPGTLALLMLGAALVVPLRCRHARRKGE